MLKSDLLVRQIRAGAIELLPNNCLEVFPMPVGAMCSISLVGDSIVTKNGRTKFQGDAFGEVLWKAGVRDNFVIVHKKNVIHVARWFSYSQHDAHFSNWVGDIEVHTFNGIEGVVDGVVFKSIEGVILPVDQIYSKSTEYSLDINFDGFMIPVKSKLGEVRYYHALPNRYAEGTILDVINWGTSYAGIIMKVDSPDGPHVILINRICMRIKDQINTLCNNGFKRVIGKRLRMTYCTYRSGDQFNNYTSTVAIRIIES